MIWASDASGATTYICPEWLLFTGRDAMSKDPFEWLEAVHPADREITRSMFVNANLEEAEFWSVYRLRKSDGEYIWVIDGAAPSFGRVEGEFLGFLGSVTEIDAPKPPSASGEFGPFRQPMPRESTKPLAPLDMIVDLVIVARMIAKEAGETELFETFEDVLRDVGSKLSAFGESSKVH